MKRKETPNQKNEVRSKKAAPQVSRIVRMVDTGEHALCGPTEWKESQKAAECFKLLFAYMFGMGIRTEEEVNTLSGVSYATCWVESDEGKNFTDEDYSVYITQEDYQSALANKNSDIICLFSLFKNPSETDEWRMRVVGFLYNICTTVFNSAHLDENNKYQFKRNRLSSLKDILRYENKDMVSEEPSGVIIKNNYRSSPYFFSVPFHEILKSEKMNLCGKLFTQEFPDHFSNLESKTDYNLKMFYNQFDVFEWIYARIFFYQQMVLATRLQDVTDIVANYDNEEYERLRTKLNKLPNHEERFNVMRFLTLIFLASCGVTKSMIKFVVFCEKVACVCMWIQEGKLKVSLDDENWRNSLNIKTLPDTFREYTSDLENFMTMCQEKLSKSLGSEPLDPLFFVTKKVAKSIADNMGDLESVYKRWIADEDNITLLKRDRYESGINPFALA